MMVRSAFVVLLFFILTLSSCSDLGEEGVPPATGPIRSDDALFRFITQVEPFTGYLLFPRVDSITSGTLNGSNAHQPLVRVSMNLTAASALDSGRLPQRSVFPDGSIIFKEIRNSAGQTFLYAVMYKDRSNPFEGNGWLWAEYRPDGAAEFSLTTRGSGCVGCHARELGPQNDFVRTFERQP